IGDDGTNKLHGGDGDDSLVGGAGADMLWGDAGRDTANYSTAYQGVVADLSSGIGTSGDAAGDRYFSIENLVGSSYADTLIGDGGDNWFNGGDGKDLTGRRAGPRRLGG